MSVFRFLTSLPSAAESSLANSRASDARAEAKSAQAEVVDIRRQVDRLQVICEAMWTIVKRGVGSDDDELLSLMVAQGRRPPRARSAVRLCPCDQASASTAERCSRRRLYSDEVQLERFGCHLTCACT